MKKIINKFIEAVYIYILPLLLITFIGFSIFTEKDTTYALSLIAAVCSCKAVMMLYESKNNYGNT